MKHPKAKTKSSYNYGRSGKHGAKRRSSDKTKGAFGKKKAKLEDWEKEEDTSHLPKCRICGIVVEKNSVDRSGEPLCEFCKEDYKQMMEGVPFYG